MTFPKYSYMPEKGMSIGIGAGYIDSDDRTIGFRNQYGERFIFTPVRAIHCSHVLLFTLGSAIGFIFGRLI